MATSDIYADEATARRQAERTKAEITSDETLLKGRANQDYRFTRSTLDRALQKGISQISDDFASRGLYRSGIRAGAQSEMGEAYIDDIGQANLTLQRELENLARASTKGMLGVNTGMESALFESTRGGMNSVLQRALNDARARNPMNV